jgi:hypothetical protein
MKNFNSQDSVSKEHPGRRSRWPWFLFGGCLLVILIALLSPRERGNPNTENTSVDARGSGTAANPTVSERERLLRRRASRATALTPEEIVASKVKQFGRSRRDIVNAIARRSKKDVPPEVEKFFDAIEAGDWDQIDAVWTALSKRSGQYEGSTHDPELDDFWMPVLEAYGTAEQAHLWPAQKLLDYGEAVLGSLRSGMVYVGGTDEGRFIPTLFNETRDGERHIVVTQNAFADGRYLDYVNFLYGDRFAALTKEDSQRAFQDYLADAQKRLQHDQQFPGEPKQIRPGEDIRMTDGKVQVSGQVAVMAINEALLRALMEKNPELSFALQESFPLKGTYGEATPLGPIMELGVRDEQNALTRERAAQSIEYWRNTARQLLADPEAAGSSATLKSFAHLAVGQANLFAERNYTAEAEQAYRLAIGLHSAHADATCGLAKLYADSGREAEAMELLNAFARNNPDQRKQVERFRGTLTMSAGR